MSIRARLSAYIALPLLLTIGSYLALSMLGERVGESPLVSAIVGCISLMIGLLPALLYRFLVHSQLQQGFAHMEDGSVRLPHELRVADLAHDRIRHWQCFDQLLTTTVRLSGTDADLLVQIRLNLTFAQDEHGKKLAQHLDEALPLLERSVQECLYYASQTDIGLASALDGSTLLNEEDERVLKSKFLCALETLAIDGIHFPHSTSGIHIDHNVKKERHIAASRPDSGELEEQDLRLDDSLLKSAGML